ncbi:MAG: DUF4412 domain-containing protein [Gemmatimonadaceae bacterium]|nr:DUF4412 domain-containing protein [Gemmatimonadaceae bacterium]
MLRAFQGVMMVLGLAAATTAADAQTTSGGRAFEGVVTMRLVMPPMAARASGAAPSSVPQQVEYFVRDGRMRVNAPGGAMSVLMIPAESKAYILMNTQSSYSELSLAPAAEPSPRAPLSGPGIDRTGRFETIAGQRCEQVRVTLASGTMVACLSSELGTYLNPLALLAGAGNAVDPMQQALANAGFPLRLARESGEVMMEVTAISRRRLDRALFSVPLEFTRAELPRRR